MTTATETAPAAETTITTTTEATEGKSSGNLSTQQLAKMLSKKSSSARAAKATNGATAAAPAGQAATERGATNGEGSNGHNAQSATNQAKLGTNRNTNGKTQTVSASTEAETGTEANEGNEEETEQGEGQQAGEPESQQAEGTEAGAEASAETGNETAAESAELPAELAEAIAEAKAGGEKGKGKLLMRVHKLVDARDTERMGRLNAEQQLAQVQARNAELEANPQQASAPQGEDPVANHPEVQFWAKEIREVDGMLSWLAQNPDGGNIPDGKGGERFVDAATVARTKANGERVRSEQVARKVSAENAVRQAHQASYAQHNATARKLYPNLFVASHADSVELQQFLKSVPNLKAFPDHEIVIGDFLRGRRARMEAAKAPVKKVAAVAARRPAPIPADASTAGEATEENEGNGKRERKQFEKTGSGKDLAKVFAAQRRARMATR